MGAYERIPENTFQTLQMNAGILCNEFDPETGIFADIIAATNSGISIEAIPEYKDFGEDVDNCPKNMLELKKIENWECKVSGTYINASAQMIRDLLGSATVSADGYHIQLKNELSPEDFKDIWFVGDYGNSGYLAIKLSKAINTKGLTFKSTKDDKGTFEFEYTGHYSVSNQDVVPLEIYIKEQVSRHDVDYQLSNVTALISPRQIVDGGTLTARFTANAGYSLPSTITVKVGDTEKTVGDDYTWNSTTGILVVKSETTTDDITIQIKGTAETYDVTYTLSNVTASVEPATIDYDEILAAKFSAASGYTLPATITITVGGETLGTNRYTWESSSGDLTIPANTITDDVVITVTGVSE